MNVSTVLDKADAAAAPLASWIARKRKPLGCVLLVLNAAPFAMGAFGVSQKDLGSVAWYLLLALLLLAPLAKITGLRILGAAVGFRKELGILMGTFALAHALMFLFSAYAPSIFSAEFWWYGGLPTFLSWGAIALALTVPLWLTSNVRSMRLLGRNWKTLHRAAYAVLLLTALHVAFIRYDWGEAAGFVAAYAVLKFLDFKKFRLRAAAA